MPSDPPISELLGQWKSGDDAAAREIANHFWTTAYGAIKGNLNRGLQNVVDRSDLANAALRSALSHVAKPDSAVGDRDEFQNWLLLICRRKAKSAQRHALAQRRDDRRTEELAAQQADNLQGAAKRDKQVTAEELLEAKELGERLAKLMLEEQDELKREAVILGIFLDCSASEIRDALLRSFPDSKPRAIRTIQSWVSAEQHRLQKALREDDENA